MKTQMLQISEIDARNYRHYRNGAEGISDTDKGKTDYWKIAVILIYLKRKMEYLFQNISLYLVKLPRSHQIKLISNYSRQIFIFIQLFYARSTT